MLTANATDNPMFVISLDIDSTGQAKTRIPDLEKIRTASQHAIAGLVSGHSCRAAQRSRQRAG